eukprot:m.265902 g.265902  ORF g.265902 m.265902 type:complete len:638 (-) comp64307_c0_seq1:146-2059(-)
MASPATSLDDPTTSFDNLASKLADVSLSASGIELTQEQQHKLAQEQQQALLQPDVASASPTSEVLKTLTELLEYVNSEKVSVVAGLSRCVTHLIKSEQDRLDKEIALKHLPKRVMSVSGDLSRGTSFRAKNDTRIRWVTAEHIGDDINSIDVDFPDKDAFSCASGSTPIMLGEEVCIVGFPYGKEPCSVLFGRVMSCSDESDAFRLDVTAVPGLSGAPVLRWDKGSWCVIGVMVSMVVDADAMKKFDDNTKTNLKVDQNTTLTEQTRRELFSHFNSSDLSKLTQLRYARMAGEFEQGQPCLCDSKQRHWAMNSSCALNLRNLQWIARNSLTMSLPDEVRQLVFATSSTGLMTAVAVTASLLGEGDDDEWITIPDVSDDELQIGKSGEKKKKAKEKKQAQMVSSYGKLSLIKTNDILRKHDILLEHFEEVMLKDKKVCIVDGPWCIPLRDSKGNDVTLTFLGTNYTGIRNISEVTKNLWTHITNETLNSAKPNDLRLEIKHSNLTHVGMFILKATTTNNETFWFAAAAANWKATGNHDDIQYAVRDDNGSPGDHTEQFCMYVFFTALSQQFNLSNGNKYSAIEMWSITELTVCDACRSHYSKRFVPALHTYKMITENTYLNWEPMPFTADKQDNIYKP